MSNGNAPGPIGAGGGGGPVDGGTLARMAAPTPDPVGLGHRASTPTATIFLAADPAASARTVTAAGLDALLGKHIHDICPNGFTDDGDNHCAHFVAHVLALEFGLTCRTMGRPGSTGAQANIRVQELFPRCPRVGAWDSRPETVTTGLVFITRATNVSLTAKTMVNVPRKHVGIFVDGRIWHYSNSKRRVVTQTPEEFSHHYPSPHDAMFYGTFP